MLLYEPKAQAPAQPKAGACAFGHCTSPKRKRRGSQNPGLAFSDTVPAHSASAGAAKTRRLRFGLVAIHFALQHGLCLIAVAPRSRVQPMFAAILSKLVQLVWAKPKSAAEPVRIVVYTRKG